MLTISFRQRKQEQPGKNNEMRYTRREFNYPSFRRSFALPENKIEDVKFQQSTPTEYCIYNVPKKKKPK
jgi:HSP20 family molecular chaperone IbpA